MSELVKVDKKELLAVLDLAQGAASMVCDALYEPGRNSAHNRYKRQRAMINRIRKQVESQGEE